MKELIEKYSLNPSDVWQLPSNKWVLKHDAIKKMAQHENLSTKLVCLDACPMGESAYVHCAVDVSGCVEVGSACDRSCNSNISRAYLSEMAFKRAEDRAILRCLKINAYSAEEADTFNSVPKGTITNVQEGKKHGT